MRLTRRVACGIGALSAPFLLATGCIVVAPLDDLPAQSAGSGGIGGGLIGEAGSTAVPRAGTGGGSAPNPNEKCTSNSDCAVRGAEEPYRCRTSDQTCVRLKSNTCPLVYGDASDPNAIFVGAFAPLSATAIDDNSVVWAYRLALDELSGDEFGGLPGGPGGARRPLVMTVCNGDSLDVDEGMQHLANEVEVPAVLANLKPGDLRRAYENFRSGQLFLLSPVGATSALAALNDQGLMWHMLGQPSDFAPVYAETLELAEKYLRKSRAITDRGVRVALITTPEAFDSGLANATIQKLVFNGKNTSDNEKDGNYRGFSVDPLEPKADETGKAIAEFRPDIVISAASEVLTVQGGVLDRIEENWGLNPRPRPPRPFYILSPMNDGDLGRVISVIENQMKGIELDPEAYRRFVGLSAARAEDPTVYNDFLVRLRTRFPKAHTETENYYDAAYFLAYAMYGAGSVAELTGPGIARGMLRLLDGKQEYNVGPAEIGAVFSALSVPGAKLTLNGALGEPDFDQQTGVRVEAGSMYCFERPSESSTVVAVRNHVLRYDRKTAQFVGEFSCFSGFFP